MYTPYSIHTCPPIFLYVRLRVYTYARGTQLVRRFFIILSTLFAGPQCCCVPDRPAQASQWCHGHPGLSWRRRSTPGSVPPLSSMAQPASMASDQPGSRATRTIHSFVTTTPSRGRLMGAQRWQVDCLRDDGNMGRAAVDGYDPLGLAMDGRLALRGSTMTSIGLHSSPATAYGQGGRGGRMGQRPPGIARCEKRKAIATSRSKCMIVWERAHVDD